MVFENSMQSARLENLRKKRRRLFSDDDHSELRELPATLIALEESIEELSTELGGDEFRGMPEVSGMFPIYLEY